MTHKEQQLAKLSPALWINRFRTRIIEHTGLSTRDAESFAPLTEIDELIDGFEDNPEGAADAQIRLWREQHKAIDEAFKDHEARPNT